MIKKEKSFLVFSFLLIISLFLLMQIFLYMKGFFALSADEAGHTLDAFYWFKGVSNFHSIWLPFQKILYTIAFNINDNLFWIPRILSSIFGLFTLISLMLLTYQLFHNRIISLITGGLGSIFWGIIVFSVLPMTEIYFSFFTITSLVFFIRWKEENSYSSLWLCLIFTVIGTTIRYEGWIFTSIIFLIVFIDISGTNENLSKKFARIFPIILFLILFPAIWLYHSYKVTGEATGFITSVAQRYKSGNIITEIKNNLIYSFLKMNFLTGNILGLFAFVILRKRSVIKMYFLIFISTVILSGIITFASKAMPTHNSWRLAAVWSIMLLPLTAYFCYYLYHNKNIYIKYSVVLIMILLVGLSFNQINKLTQISFMKKSDFIVGTYIRDNLLKVNSDRIFIQASNWEYTNILITSERPGAFYTEKHFLNHSSHTSVPFYESIKAKLKNYSVRYIILKPYNEDYFDLSKLKLVKRFNNWIIYKLN